MASVVRRWCKTALLCIAVYSRPSPRSPPYYFEDQNVAGYNGKSLALPLPQSTAEHGFMATVTRASPPRATFVGGDLAGNTAFIIESPQQKATIGKRAIS